MYIRKFSGKSRMRFSSTVLQIGVFFFNKFSPIFQVNDFSLLNLQVEALTLLTVIITCYSLCRRFSMRLFGVFKILNMTSISHVTACIL
jgi:hypothetical protein